MAQCIQVSHPDREQKTHTRTIFSHRWTGTTSIASSYRPRLFVAGHAACAAAPVPTYNLRVWTLCLVCLTSSVAAHAATLTLAWDRNPEPDIAGYVVYRGTQPGVHPYSRNVGNAISQQVDGLADGTTYYFVATAYNTAGLMSLPSAEVSGQTSGGGGCTTCGAGPDLNGDSTPDLVWQNDSTRQVAVWYSGWSARKYLSRLGLAFVRLD